MSKPNRKIKISKRNHTTISPSISNCKPKINGKRPKTKNIQLIIKPDKPLTINGKKSVIEFYNANKSGLTDIKSIKIIYKMYVEYMGSETPINEYIFRTHLRKSGYCNSCTSKKMCKKCERVFLKNKVEELQEKVENLETRINH
jgi:hypothetical protein